MGVGKNRLRSALGNDPLSKSIFSKTDANTAEEQTSPPTEETRNKNQESTFLSETEREKVNLRLPIELNDWLDDLVKKGKRGHGRKIPKEVWVQAALEFFRSMPINWEEIDTVDALKRDLKNLESRIKKNNS